MGSRPLATLLPRPATLPVHARRPLLVGACENGSTLPIHTRRPLPVGACENGRGGPLFLSFSPVSSDAQCTSGFFLFFFFNLSSVSLLNLISVTEREYCRV